MKTTEAMKYWQSVFDKKQSDYGTAWKKTGKILDILFDGQEIKINSVKDYNVLALLIRTIDKTCRFTNLYFKNNEQKVDDESLGETTGDNGTYWFMMHDVVTEEDDG